MWTYSLGKHFEKVHHGVGIPDAMRAAMQLGTGIYRLPLLDGNEKTLCLLSQSSLMVRKTHIHLFSDAI